MATYPTHGVHLRQRHPNRWLLVAIVVVAALVGAGAWALVDHYTGGTTETTTGPATLTSSGVANKYISALDKLQPYALTPILAKNAGSIDWAYGSSVFHGAKTLEENWAGVFAPDVTGDTHWRGSLRAAAPDWAAVTWRWRGTTNPLTDKPFKESGLSILNIKHGKVVRETYYWDVPEYPGWKHGIAPSIGRNYATALSAHQPGMAPRLGSLYSAHATEVDMAAATRKNVIWRMGTPLNLIWGRWGDPSLIPLHASLRCAGRGYRMDNGTIRNSWAVVDWVAKLHSTGGKVSGVSILQLNKQGEITRETLYY